MPKQYIAHEIDVPEGYTITGEYRIPTEGEYILSPSNGSVHIAPATKIGVKFFILRKTEVWKPLTLEIATEYAKQKKKIVIRARHCQGAVSESVVETISLIRFAPYPGEQDIHFSTTGWFYIENTEYLEESK